MADYWTTPKINWVDTDGIGYEDFNRIESNIKAHSDANFRKVQGFGYTISNAIAGEDGVITIKRGSCYSDNGVPIRMDAPFIKNIKTWAQGSGADKGGMASAVTVAAITWYYIFVISDPTNGSVDIMLDDNPAGTNVASGVYTEKRRIGAIKTYIAGDDGSFLILEMYSVGDHTYINTTLVYNSGTVFPNSAPNNDKYNTVTLALGAGLALPALEVRADLNILSSSVNWGLISRLGGFTIPGALMAAGEPQGEFCYKHHHLASALEATVDVDIMIDSANQIDLAMWNSADLGNVEIRVRGFHDERLI